VLAARMHAHGLLATQTAATKWASGAVDVDLLGLVLVADAPGRLSRPLRDLARLVSGGLPRVWNLPWIEAWRLGEPPSLEFIPKAVRAMVTDLNTGMGEQWFKKFLGWLIAFISLIAMPALMKFVAPMASLGGAMAGSAGLVGGKLASGAMKLGQDQADNGAHRPAWHRRDGHRVAKEVKPAMAVCTVAHAEHHAGQTGRVSSGTVATA